MGEAVDSSLILIIGEQEVRLRAPAEDHERLKAIAERLNRQIDGLRGGKLGGPRLLAMALFQQAVELEDLRESLERSNAGSDRLNDLIRRIDQATGRDAG